MPLPSKADLTAQLKVYVDAGAGHDEYLASCVNDATAFIASRVPNIETTENDEVVDVNSPMGEDLYRREVIELGSELFYRRQARNGVVSVGPDGSPIRISADPFKAAESRLSRFWLGFG